MIAERLESIPGLSGRYELLPKDEAHAQIQDLQRLLRELDSRHNVEVRHFDARDALPSEIGDWLAIQNLGDEQVRLYWPYDSDAALMNIKDVILFIDKLWYPSSDDLLILPTSNQYVIEIDHEEQVFLRALNGRMVSAGGW
jgi:hypothetical protein